jgi:hypothetical protein
MGQFEIGRVHIHLFSSSQSLLTGQGTRKGHANWSTCLQVDFWEERIVARNWNGPAFGVDVGWRVAVTAIQNGVLESAGNGCQGDVVIEELTKKGEHHCVATVHVTDVLMDDNGDETRRRKRLVSD